MTAMRRVVWLLLLLVPIGAQAAPALLDSSALEQDSPGTAPTGWQLVGGTAPWVVQEAEGGRSIASTTVLANASFLTRSFEGPVTPYVVRLEAFGHANPALRGLSFGLSYGSPQGQPARAMHLSLGPNGQLSYFDGATWIGLAPFEAGRWHQIAVTVFPREALFVVSLDGQSVTPTPLPFWNEATPNTLFFNNYAAGEEGSTILVRGIEIVPTPDAVPPVVVTAEPKGLRITNVTQDQIALDWLPNEQPITGYRLYRNNQLLRELPADATRYTDTGLPHSTLFIYRLAAMLPGEYPEESALSRPAADWTLPPASANAPDPARTDYDVVVVGATPGGISAALAAAGLGASVALVEPSRWIGGMMAGGLSNTDFRYKETHGGYFKEFTRQVLDYYRTVYGPETREVRVSNEGYKFEPRVARAVLTRMLAAQRGISLYRQMRATGVGKEGNRVTAVTFEDLTGGPARTFTGKTIIDATYEGDIAAYAGARYRVGRESKEEFNEQHAGELFWDMNTRKIVWGSGAGDHRVQAYNYRLTMTNRPDNRLPVPKPEGYDRALYLKIIPDARSGYANFRRIVGFQGQLPNDKWDINNSSAYWPSTDFVGANYDYPEADWKRREEIIRAHRSYIQGLLYFLQNDPELPEAFRLDANRWGLARDEFVDNENWPTQLYVREGRRLQGAYWFTENDTRPRPGEQRSPLQPEGVGVGDYSLDSHATQPPRPDQPHLIEGFFYGGHTEPYQVPFGVMVPQGFEGLLVPVAVSATHIGLSTIRMEPTWMALGQAAGTAAYISQRHGVPLRQVPVPLVQDVTLLARQVTIFLRDVGYDHPDFRGLNYGALIGLFPGYQSEPNRAIDRGTAAQWLWQWMRHRWPELPEPREAARFTDVPEGSPLAPAVGVLVEMGALAGAEAGAAFRPTDPVSVAEAARWIARAHRTSDRWNHTMPVESRAHLEQQIVGLLEGAAGRDARIAPERLTRGQFLTLLYLAAETATPR